MNRLVILILLLLAASGYAASYEARSQHHAIAVAIVPLGVGEVRFDVTVAELPGGQVLIAPRLQAKMGEPSKVEVTIGGQRVRINLLLRGSTLACALEVQKGGAITDSIHTSWSIQPLGAAFQPPPSGDWPLRVGGDVKAPVVIYRVEPVYTEKARKAAITGIVIVEVIVDEAGVVKDAHVLKPLPFGLDEAAIDAVKKWRFRPGTLNGKPVEVLFNFPLKFQLDSPPPPSPR